LRVCPGARGPSTWSIGMPEVSGQYTSQALIEIEAIAGVSCERTQ
jgi:hypothetical protein